MNLLVGDMVFITTDKGEIVNDVMYVCISTSHVVEYQYLKKRCKLKRIEELSKLKNKRLAHYPHVDNEWGERFEEFVKWHDYDCRAVILYINSLRVDTKFVEGLPKLIPHLDKIDRNEYLTRYHELLSLARPGDMIFLFNPRSITSHVITYFTHGPWSHCANIHRNYMVADMRPAGLLQLPIEFYYLRHYRIGLYRLKEKGPDQHIEAFLNHIDKNLIEPSPRFGFLLAIKAGYYNWRGYLKEGYETPMDLIYNGQFRLIHTV